MSPGSPDASDELQVIPRRPSGSPAGPSSWPPASGRRNSADPARKRRFVLIVAGALGMCTFILVAAGIARAVRPRETQPSVTATSSSAAVLAPTPTGSAIAAATAPPVPAPTTGAVYFDRPAAPGKIWLDGKKVTSRSVEVPCGKHRVKIGTWGKTHSVSVPCGGDLHLAR